MTMLRLKNLSIRAIEWGADKGRLQGEIEFVGESGKVSVTLSPADCERLLPVVAESIVTASREVAERLTQEAMGSLPVEKLQIA
jgi:hypothetical protein